MSLVKSADSRAAGGAAGGVVAKASTQHASLVPLERTSALLAPIMQLTGHQGEVFDVKFSPDGQMLASSSHDKSVMLWSVFGQDGHDACKNVIQLRGHTGPITGVQWSADGRRLFSVSADQMMAMWDVETRQRVRRFRGHSTFIQSCAITRSGSGVERLLTAGDDGRILMWDARDKSPIAVFEHEWAVTSLAFNAEADEFFAGSIDNTISTFKIETGHVSYTLQGHADMVTGLSLSPDGASLLSNGADNTVRIWDVKPFSVVPNRLSRILGGAPHAFDKNLLRCCWNPDGSQVCAGSGDRTVVVWDVDTGRLEYKLPGHQGTVNCVDWHPQQPIIASGSVDRTIFVGEINPSASVYRARND